MATAPPSMRAAVCTGPGRLALEERPIPEPGPGEARVRISACGICGTDLHLLPLGYLGPRIVPGHEMAGVVDALGEGARGPAIGEAVAVEPLVSCGGCGVCREGRFALCRELRVPGIHRDGGFAGYVTVPADRLFRVPGDLPPALAALAEPMAVVVHGLRRARLAEGHRVLVIGAGTLGLLAVVAGHALGAKEVWLTARYDHQEAHGRRLGAARVLREKEATAERLRELGAEVPFDAVLETVGGDADTVRLAAEALSPGGTISVVGLHRGPIRVDPLPVFLKEATLAWSNCYEHPHEGADFETATALLDAHRDALAPLVTHPVPLAEIERAIAIAGDKQAGAVKVSVLPETP